MPACKYIAKFSVNLLEIFRFDMTVDNSSGRPLNAILKIVKRIFFYIRVLVTEVFLKSNV